MTAPPTAWTAGTLSADLAPPVHRPAPEPDAYEIRTGHSCRACGQRLAWPGPAVLMFADGTAECHFCAESGRPGS